MWRNNFNNCFSYMFDWLVFSYIVSLFLIHMYYLSQNTEKQNNFQNNLGARKSKDSCVKLTPRSVLDLLGKTVSVLHSIKNWFDRLVFFRALFISYHCVLCWHCGWIFLKTTLNELMHLECCHLPRPTISPRQGLLWRLLQDE